MNAPRRLATGGDVIREAEQEPIRALLLQRMIMDYRLPIFRRLATHDQSIRWQFGCSKNKRIKNAHQVEELSPVRFWAICLPLRIGGESELLVWWPTLLFHLVWTRPDVILTEGESNLPNNLAVAIYCHIFRKPYVWWGLGTVRKPKPTIWRRVFGCVLDTLCLRAGAVVAYNSYARDFYISRGVKAASIFVAQNTIDDAEVCRQMELCRASVPEARSSIGLGEGPCMVFIGRLNHGKRVDILLNAYDLLTKEYHFDSKPELLVIGDGPARGELEELALCLGVSQGVFFVGRHVEDVSLYLMMGDIVVLPGLGGLAINHAFAHGLPVVCGETDGGERDLVQTGINGILLESPVTPDSLATALAPLLADRERLAEMRKKARDTFAVRASPGRMLDAIVTAIRVALSRTNP